MEIFSFLVVLGILLAFVTLVGHGIWVFLSNLFGSGRGKPLTDPSNRPMVMGSRACPRCGTSLDVNDSTCRVCGWPTGSRNRSSQAALSSVREQLERLARLGALDSHARERLIAAVMEEERLARDAEVAAAHSGSQNVATSEEAAAMSALVEPVAHVAEALAEPAASVEEVKPPIPLRERARKYAVSRKAAATEAPPLNHVSEGEGFSGPSRQREALSRLVAAFMEENNIRWGELVGGLLIVGCSIALVISFWSQIAERPLLKFVLFNGVTAALFGIGLYTNRRWKIHTTSHGLLIIATLLVPLNFLAIAAFTQTSLPSDLLTLGGEAASLAIFAVLILLAGRILVAEAAPLLVVGVMIPSLMQLVMRRFAGPNASLGLVYGLAIVPLASYLGTTMLVAGRRLAEGGVTAAAAPRLLAFLGLVSVATLMPLALLAYLAPRFQESLHRLSPLLVTAGLPALVVGLLFWRRGPSATRQVLDSESIGAKLSTNMETAGTAVGVLGALAMAGAVVLAWPDPATMLPTSLVTAVALTAVAVCFGIPEAHVPAGLMLAGAWLVGFHLLRGNVAWMLPSYEPMSRALLSAASGHALVPLVGMFAAVAAWLTTRTRRRALAEPVAPMLSTSSAGYMYGLVAVVTAAVGLLLVLWFGWGRSGDPQGATWTLAIYAVAALVAAATLDRLPIAWAAAALLLVTLVQAIVYRYGQAWQLERSYLVALLAFASLAAVLFGALRAWVRRGQANLQPALSWSALAASIGAAVILVATARSTSAEALAVHLAWLAVVWLALAAMVSWPGLFVASQAALLLAIICGVTAALETRLWYITSERPWLDPWFLAAQGVALSAFCLAMILTRTLSTRGSARIAAQHEAAWGVERALEIGLVLLTVGVAIYGALPGIAQELAPLDNARGSGPAVRVVPPIERFEIAAIPHAHAAGWGTWALVGAVATVLMAGLWQGRRSNDWRILGLLLIAAAMCPLLAARWETDVAVASALRWILAVMFAVVSVPLWWIRREDGAPADFGELDSTELAEVSRVEPVAHAGLFSAENVSHNVRDVLVAIVVLVYVLMGVYVSQAALWRAGWPRSVDWLWPYLAIWALAAGVAAVMIPRSVPSRGPSSLQRIFDPKHRGKEYLQCPPGWAPHVRDVLLLLAFAPIAILVTFAVAMALDQHPVVGPELGSWFRRIGWDVSYGLPLTVTALVLIGHAVRDRSAPFAFAAGLLFNVVATIVVLLRLASGGGQLDAAAWITVAQVNAIVAGVVGLVWLVATKLGAERREHRASTSSSIQIPYPWLLVTQVALAAALCAMFLVPATVGLALEPVVPAWVGAADGLLGWSAVALATVAAFWINGRRGVSQNGVALFAAALVALAALTATRWDTGNWLAFHTLLVGCTAAAWLAPIATRAAGRWMQPEAAPSVPMIWSAPSVRAFAVISVLLAAWGYEGDPGSPWWTLAVLVAIGARNVWMAVREGGREFVWLAALLFHPAASIFWLDWANQFSASQGFGEALDLVWVNVIAAAAMALLSIWVERQVARQPVGSRHRAIAFHRFAMWAIVAALLLTTGAGLVADLSGNSITVGMPLAWAAWAAAVVAAVACWWDAAVRWQVAALYCVGLAGIELYLDGLDLQPPLFGWALALALAAFSLATSALWSVRDRLRAGAVRWGMPVEPTASQQATWHEGSGHDWLVPMNFLLGIGVLILVVWIELSMEDFGQRMIAAYAIGAQAFALGLLARGAVRTPLQYLALVWGVFFAVAFGWAWLPPEIGSGPGRARLAVVWLDRLVVSAAALAATVVVYGFGLVKFLKRENEWTRAAARLVPLLAVLAAALILAAVAIETVAFLRHGEVPIRPAALVTVIVALAGLVVAALMAALVPGRDPLSLSERGRTLYVYAAEALAGLLFLHIRVTMPWLFTGWFLRFWPLVVMAIAFVGVGLGELFQRRRRPVLSEPLETTGALLPVLPALGFWVMSSQVHYSLLLLSIGVLYAALSVLRGSFLYGMLAAVAANGSLWYLLSRGDGLRFFEHPQLWLIPPALSVLVATYINRERLSPEQSAALRYGAAIVIYVASTADVFINGVAEAPWLPAVLAGLSIAGVLAGIMLRVRAFLYLGTAFLVVALMTIIWHAAIEQQRTWILWVAGIVTGALIIALFGLFEKRRDDVLRVVEQLKHWEA